MITQWLKKIVVAEALNIRKYATKKEISRLDFRKIKSNNAYQCIYGQMTECCLSERAIELLNKCARPYSHSNIIRIKPMKKEFFIGVRDVSPIEFYISQPKADIEMLIKIIKS